MKQLVIILTTYIFFSGPIYAQTLQAGYYNAYDVSIVPRGNFYTGYFEASGGQKGHGYSCKFFFLLKNNKVYSCNDSNYCCNEVLGNYTITKNNEFTMTLNTYIPGEIRFEYTFTKPNRFLLDDKKNWIDIRVVKAKKSYLFSSDDTMSKRKGYVIEGNVLKVLKKNKNWLYIEYINIDSDNTLFAWVKADDCY